MGRGTRVQVWRRPDWPGLSAVVAEDVATPIVRHVHDRVVVGLCLAGSRRFVFRDGEWLAGPGALAIIPAGEPHACLAGPGPDQVYLALALDARWLAGPPAGPAVDPPRVLVDRDAADSLVRCVRALETGAGPAGELARALAGRLGLGRGAGRPVHPAARLARERIEAAPEEALPLAELARLVGVSPFYLERVFARDIGVPLGDFRLDRRVRLAVERLRAGDDPAAAALAAGFCDQSHLTRQFTRRVGAPPGRCRAV